MSTPLRTDRQRYYHLFSLVCEDLPVGLVDAVVQQGHEAPASQLLAVRNARKPHLSWLIDLVRAGLPNFEIPASLLPAERALAGRKTGQQPPASGGRPSRGPA